MNEGHPDHEVASDWFNINYADGWLTCPLTQNGCVRILLQTKYSNARSIIPPMERLRTAMSAEHHQFINDDVSLFDDALVNARWLSGPKQLTDVYLLALAVAHGARLVTLDTRIPLNAVRGASESHLFVIARLQPPATTLRARARM